MITTRVSPRYTLKIPAELRRLLKAGQAVLLDNDDEGRIIVTPIPEQPQAKHSALTSSFGMWSDRAVDELRSDDRIAD